MDGFQRLETGQVLGGAQVWFGECCGARLDTGAGGAEQGEKVGN